MLFFIELFIIIFIIVLLIYEIIFNKYKVKKNKKKRKLKNTYPMEVMIMTSFYKIDIENVNYNKFLNVLAVVSSFDIALIVSIVSLINNGILQILVAFLLIIPIIFLSYYLVSLFYKRKKEVK